MFILNNSRYTFDWEQPKEKGRTYATNKKNFWHKTSNYPYYMPM